MKILLSENNLLICLGAIFPVIFYLFFLKSKTPFNSISIKKTYLYLVTGALSVLFVQYFSYIFPNWNSYLLFYIPNPILITACFAFIQVGFIEELMKRFANKIGKSIDSSSNTFLGTIYYGMVTSASFALLENILYVIRYSPIDTIVIRTFTAIPLHLACGILMGYYMALANECKQNKIFDKFNTRINFYRFLSVLIPTFVHGTYDFIIMADLKFRYLLIFMLFIVLFFNIKDIFKLAIKKELEK